jgi:hypothetical protein
MFDEGLVCSVQEADDRTKSLVEDASNGDEDAIALVRTVEVLPAPIRAASVTMIFSPIQRQPDPPASFDWRGCARLCLLSGRGDGARGKLPARHSLLRSEAVA